MRSRLKPLVERMVLASGAKLIGKRRLRRRSLILAYHNVVPDGLPRAGDWSAHIELSTFCRQLDILQSTFDVVSLEGAFEESSGGRPRVAITFDDAYVGAVTIALEELRARALPSVCFVSPGFLDGATFWWDVLADHEGELSPADRSHVLAQLNGLNERARDWARSSGRTIRDMPPVRTAASVDDLRRAGERGMRLGAHTWSHPALPTLDSAAMHDELRRSLRWLVETFRENATPWLAYPYGLCSPSVISAAKSVGYEGALLSVGGSFAPASDVDRFAVPRLTVPASISDASFQLWVLGLRI